MKSRLAGWPPPLICLRLASNGGELAAGRYSGNSVEYSHKKPLQIANARQPVRRQEAGGWPRHSAVIVERRDRSPISPEYFRAWFSYRIFD
jgi:hypothetical protein